MLPLTLVSSDRTLDSRFIVTYFCQKSDERIASSVRKYRYLQVEHIMVRLSSFSVRIQFPNLESMPWLESKWRTGAIFQSKSPGSKQPVSPLYGRGAEAALTADSACEPTGVVHPSRVRFC
jgi:hypothetical protein